MPIHDNTAEKVHDQKLRMYALDKALSFYSINSVLSAATADTPDYLFRVAGTFYDFLKGETK